MAFFEGRDIDSLTFIAKRLKSDKQKDIELACKLLGFLPNIDLSSETLMQNHYTNFVQWIFENYSFLLYAGENLKRIKITLPYKVAWEAKYLCKRVNIDTGNILEELTSFDYRLINQFSTLNFNAKQLLSNYSYRFNRKNIELWHVWLSYPISEQIRIAMIGEL